MYLLDRIRSSEYDLKIIGKCFSWENLFGQESKEYTTFSLELSPINSTLEELIQKMLLFWMSSEKNLEKTQQENL
ncbi:unnamed protein product [Blepharisma stoltei]|uniref:Uncharacterized protein n=1 Tax=Blepharisma stoltei TaxID=1481888 RepID=A0AAU9IIZ4_9CILI|nr:unnamed protein product [Blepharisma stoltei]